MAEGKEAPPPYAPINQQVPVHGQQVQYQVVQQAQGQPVQYIQGQQPVIRVIQQPVQGQPIQLQQTVNAQGQVVYVQQVAVAAPQVQAVSYFAADPALQQELETVSMNQLNFFRALNQWYSSLLIEDQYTEKQENNKLFWEGIIMDYEMYMDKIAADPSSEITMRHSIPHSSEITISLEMELVWRIHVLNPQCYVSDCIRKFGKIIGRTKQWQNHTRHNTTNFRRNVLKNQSPANTGFISPDLVMTDAIKRQCKFIRKMIKINMFYPITLADIKAAITRYDQFLQAMWAPDKPQGLVMVPTLDLDLIWHSHQLNPIGYHSFCTTRSPHRRLVWHDDNLGDDVLRVNGVSTQQFWNSRYGANTYLSGRAFREPAGNQQYDNMKIYDDWPQWKVLMVVSAVVTLGIAVFLAFIDNIVACVVVVLIGCSILCCVYSRKSGDISHHRRRRAQRSKYRSANCGGGCGAYCGTGVDGGTGVYGGINYAREFTEATDGGGGGHDDGGGGGYGGTDVYGGTGVYAGTHTGATRGGGGGHDDGGGGGYGGTDVYGGTGVYAGTHTGATRGGGGGHD
eukprot:41823_1